MRFSLSILATVLTIAQSVVAQAPVPFDLTGGLDDVTATNLAVFNTGGTLSLLGHTIVVPANLLVQFPAAFVPWRDFVGNKSALLGFEVSVSGNFVNEVPIAGFVSASQFDLGGGAGIIESVGTDGTMLLEGGPRLRINTPGGVYGTAYTVRPMFTSDESSPSITAFSGFPMCIPRSANDPACPSANRPANGNRVYRAPLPKDMAPFRPGDYVTYSGVTNGPNEYVCHTINAENLQILTSADAGEPVYIRVEDALIGINDGAGGLIVEYAETRYIGYISDPTASLNVYALEIDPCTGVETERQVASGVIKAGDARNKFVIRFTDNAATSVTREYRVKTSKGQVVTNQGIEAGQYVTPVTEVVWPEVNLPGSLFPANMFNQFTHLKNGFVFDNKQWGQLTPFPGVAPSPSKVCTGNELNPVSPPPPAADAVPVAAAGADVAARAGTRIALVGSNTNTNLTDAQVTFSWKQTMPSTENIVITDANTASASFIAPTQTSASVSRTFQLTTCLVNDATKCSTDDVLVKTDTRADTITITSYQFASKQSGTITVVATSNVVLTGTGRAALTLTFGGTTVQMVQDTSNGGTYTYSARSVGKQPANIVVRSALGGSSTQAALLRRRTAIPLRI